MLAVVAVIALIAVPLALRTSTVPMTPLEARIVRLATGELGYHTNPRHSYCNRFSAYWDAGITAGCPAGERSEEWCVDFAAWVWQRAGVPLTYGYAPGDLNGAAASVYEWAVAHHRWHAARGYVAAPGDIAVYGLELTPAVTAAHVAIVTEDSAGQAGPDVVNGDGDRTGYSVVEAVDDEVTADGPGTHSRLSGYVSPPPVRAHRAHGVSHSTT